MAVLNGSSPVSVPAGEREAPSVFAWHSSSIVEVPRVSALLQGSPDSLVSKVTSCGSPQRSNPIGSLSLGLGTRIFRSQPEGSNPKRHGVLLCKHRRGQTNRGLRSTRADCEAPGPPGTAFPTCPCSGYPGARGAPDRGPASASSPGGPRDLPPGIHRQGGEIDPPNPEGTQGKESEGKDEGAIQPRSRVGKDPGPLPKTCLRKWPTLHLGLDRLSMCLVGLQSTDSDGSAEP